MPRRYYRRLSPEMRAGRLSQCRDARAGLAAIAAQSLTVTLTCGCVAHRVSRMVLVTCSEHRTTEEVQS